MNGISHNPTRAWHRKPFVVGAVSFVALLLLAAFLSLGVGTVELALIAVVAVVLGFLSMHRNIRRV